MFQVDLGLAVMEYRIEKDWKDTDDKKPKWMRQTQLISCMCEKCFFCKSGFTNGITHAGPRLARKRGRKRKIPVTPECSQIRERWEGSSESGIHCKLCIEKRRSDMLRNEIHETRDEIKKCKD